jgi:hypothetical protein
MQGTLRAASCCSKERVMIEFFKAGGFPMFVVLFLGLAALIAAGLFAFRPDEGRVGTIRALSTSTGFSVLAAVAADLATVCYTVASNPEFSKSDELHLIVLMGIAESLTPAIMGCTMLALVWMMVAVGHRRLAASGR